MPQLRDRRVEYFFGARAMRSLACSSAAFSTYEGGNLLIILYHGGGATLTDVLSRTLTADEWTKIRSAAKRLASARGAREAAQVLDDDRFELMNGTNFFGDEFSVLFARVPVEAYAELGELEANPKSEKSFRTIAETISEIGPYTRFVAVALDTEERVVPVRAPSPRVTSESVDRALQDAEQLIQTNGAASAVDRVHTVSYSPQIGQ